MKNSINIPVKKTFHSRVIIQSLITQQNILVEKFLYDNFINTDIPQFDNNIGTFYVARGDTN